MNPALKGCPFCEAPAVFERDSDHHGDFFSLGCSRCECPGHHVFYTELAENEANAIAAWNRRAPDPSAFKAGLERAAEVADEHRARIKNHNPDDPEEDLVTYGYGNAALNIASSIRSLKGGTADAE